MDMSSLLERGIWVVNGALVVLYFAFGNISAIIVAVSSVFFVKSAPNEQKSWTIASSLLSLTGILIAPNPAPIFILIMSMMGWAALYLEQYNKISQRWTATKGQALYAILSLGYSAWMAYGANSLPGDAGAMQGLGYFNTLAGISLYVFPIGFLTWVTQSIWAHPPAPSSPENLINTVRGRGKG